MAVFDGAAGHGVLWFLVLERRGGEGTGAGEGREKKISRDD